jgi:enoyl-CoA hydratase/carnithine racemase
LRGAAVGRGLAIALACDLRFAADDTHIAVPSAKLGLLYGPVETRLLVEIVGSAAAKDLLFSGRSVPTDEAIQMGLINRRTSLSSLDRDVENRAKDWALLSGSSIRGAKKAVRAVLASNFDRVRELVEAAATSDDFSEGRAAFRAKQPPLFSQRG